MDHLIRLRVTKQRGGGAKRTVLKGRAKIAVLAGVVAAMLPSAPAHAADLRKHTVEAYNRYVKAAEARMANDLRNGRFLVIDDLPDGQRKEAYAELQDGMLRIQRMQATESGKPIKIPDGMVHDWVGLAFIPNATLPQTLAVFQDYARYQDVYKPDIQRSRLLTHDGNDYKVYMRYFRKAIVTVTFDTDMDVRYTLLGNDRVLIRSTSTRIAEVADAGQPDEHELPVGNDHGYVWRFENYWNLEQKDGGVYVQIEAIALSRNIPFIFRWLINPLVESIPRQLLADLLTATRKAVEQAGKKSPAHPADPPQISGEPARPARPRSARPSTPSPSGSPAAGLWGAEKPQEPVREYRARIDSHEGTADGASDSDWNYWRF
jgi:hypothetical protein